MFSGLVNILPLAKHHDRSAFSCGVTALDQCIKEQASQDIRRHVATVFVAAVDNRVIGFYSLSATIISHYNLPEHLVKKLPRYPIPAVLLGRLAVDSSCKGQSLGKALMVNAMKRALLASTTIGMYALIVDAKDEKAVSFYQHFGFKELANYPMRLFLPMDTIEELLAVE